MNKVRIIGIIAIIAIIVNIIGSLDDEWRSFKEGWKEGDRHALETLEPGRRIIPHNAVQVQLKVEPLPGSTIDSLCNNSVDWPLPYKVSKIKTYAKPSPWYILFMGLIIPGMLCFFIGFYFFIRLLISISRREVFTATNVWRIRWFAYSSAILKILIAIIEWFTGSAAMEQINLPGYEIISYTGASTDWIAVVIPVLFAEIFAVGVKIKEEQDLTI